MRANRPALRLLLSFGLALLCSVSLAQQVTYHLDPVERAHHELQVAVEFTGVTTSELEVRMSRSSPGRYALHEFAKNVYSVRASNAAGQPLEVKRLSPHQWTVTTNGSRTVRFYYTLFADRVDGTYSAVDRSHLHLNAPATFAWAVGFEQRPAQVVIELPEGWRVATQLESTEQANVFRAKDLQALMDAPIEASEFWMASWAVPGPGLENGSLGPSQTVRVALHHDGSDERAETYAELTAAIVAEQISVFGDVPSFDHGVYTFLADYLPYASGDGMEHRNSTILSSSLNLEDSMVRLLGTVSHEFFHAWNIERIRPQSLEPFDFSRANMSSDLWFGEGFTSYYDDLTLKRAGVISFERYVEGISRSVGGFLIASGRRYRSPEEMSHQASFVDAASWIDPTNLSNTFISYYSYGAVLGLALDLELRQRFDLTLDHFMREVWQRHGKTEKPYTRDDLVAALAHVSDQSFADDFFARFIVDSEAPDYATLLEPAGLSLVKSSPDDAWVGRLALKQHGKGLELEGATQVGTPLYAAGLNRGDVITQVDGQVTKDPETFSRLVDAAGIGGELELTVLSRGVVFETQLQVEGNPALHIRTFEQEDREVTAAIRQFRDDWLGKRSERPLNAKKRCPEGHQEFAYEVAFCPWHGAELEPFGPASSR